MFRRKQQQPVVPSFDGGGFAAQETAALREIGNKLGVEIETIWGTHPVQHGHAILIENLRRISDALGEGDE